MGKHFFDFEDGDFAFTVSDNMAIDSDGNMMMRMGDNMAMDMDSGDLHIISSWDRDEGDDSRFGGSHSLLKLLRIHRLIILQFIKIRKEL